MDLCNRNNDDRKTGVCPANCGGSRVVELFRVTDNRFLCLPCIERRMGRRLVPEPVSGYEARPMGAHWCHWKLVTKVGSIV